METDSAVNEWQINYEMSSDQVNLMQTLFDRRVGSPGKKIAVSRSEFDILIARGIEGIDECQELLAGIDIILPIENLSC